MKPLFDAHVHLCDWRLAPHISAFDALAQQSSVTACISCASFPNEWFARPISSLNTIYAYGLHPWVAERATATELCTLRELLVRNPSSLIGEVGLDGVRPSTDGGRAQLALFEAQISLACELKRPMILHGARKWSALFNALAPKLTRLPAVMLHGATFSPDMLNYPIFRSERIWVSFGADLLNPAAQKVQALATAVPLDRILIETDSPDRLPKNEPPLLPNTRLNHCGLLPKIAQTLAHLRKASIDLIAEQTFANAQAFLSSR